ncbi:3-hydroxyacyl-CoA dehydrogenase NAD-binding domain-containing protein [Saccharopolyspora pogona]|uniref:3-hydroxyacyl-CoA dehydrogenase NAD-binding domain-containing protein n=1 Tax=Saccharopolyspora pogona TaxID=333966 RepID=UPI0021E079F2|nr:3-hydroxyacyl-CoA dehydrogenase NAD-binding domain-containing protein [Saccharopolyspora pogona]
MGAGIAEVCARAGKNVVVVEETREGALAGSKRIEASLERAAQRGKIDSAQVIPSSRRARWPCAIPPVLHWAGRHSSPARLAGLGVRCAAC